jgi:GT2 family glycosyltransferase
MKTAVVIIVFNRPDVTARVMERIREARPATLFVIADGARKNREGEAAKCQEVRSLVEAMVDWPCGLVKIYSEANLGCGRRVASGLNEVFRLVEEAIILEDDCLPDPTFFRYCEELLERYRDNERVGHIAGCTFLPEGVVTDSYFFSRYPHSWGWATWRRAWVRFDYDMQAWRNEREKSWRIGPRKWMEKRAWKRHFDHTLRAELDTWDYQWTSACWTRGVWSIIPGRNLVSNLGYGPDATHTREGPWGNLPVGTMSFPLKHPAVVKGDERLDDLIGRKVFAPPSFVQRLANLLKRTFNR